MLNNRKKKSEKEYLSFLAAWSDGIYKVGLVANLTQDMSDCFFGIKGCFLAILLCVESGAYLLLDFVA